jgi:ABC-type multidrug transport system ATPase subunit
MLKLTLDHLSRDFEERKVLKDLCATFEGGVRLLVRGRNGSGKTTLLKIVAGVLAPSGGKVEVEDGGEARDAAWRRRWTGYLAPDLVLYEEFSAMENLDFFARVRGLTPDPARDRDLLTRMGLGRRTEDPLGTLSTGLRQRAKLAFALQAEPRILLMDEPGSNLDQVGRDLVHETVDAFAGPDRIVVVATNDPAEFDLGTRTLELG